MAGTERNPQPTVEVPQSKRGRPPGETDPTLLLKQELIAHLRLYKKVREIVETQIESCSDPDELAKYMDLLRKGIADLAKPFVAAAKPEIAKPIEEEDGEKILARLLGA
jgi:hypothetical protein